MRNKCDRQEGESLMKMNKITTNQTSLSSWNIYYFRCQSVCISIITLSYDFTAYVRVCMLLFFFVELLCFLSFAFSGKFVFFFARSLVLHINWMRSIFTSAVQLIVSYVYLYEYVVVLCAWHIIRIIRKYNRGCICTVPCGCFLA